MLQKVDRVNIQPWLVSKRKVSSCSAETFQTSLLSACSVVGRLRFMFLNERTNASLIGVKFDAVYEHSRLPNNSLNKLHLIAVL
jgi:hypothetical protein